MNLRNAAAAFLLAALGCQGLLLGHTPRRSGEPSVTRSRVERITPALSQMDPFVGDKLSPDLRLLMASPDRDRRVGVIIQASGIESKQLGEVLRKSDAVVKGKAVGLGMIMAELPVRAAEALAKVHGVQHISLDRGLKRLGHIEKTTGAEQMRTIQQGLNVGLLGIGVLNTSVELTGEGIGIAIVDSGIRENHRSFVNSSGSKRVIKRANFAPGNSVSTDRFGHGTHVASLAAGGGGANLMLATGFT